MIKRITRRTWWYGGAAAALAAVIGLTLHGCDALSESRPSTTAPRADADTGLVCLGHVDVEGGVQRLGIAQSGRVTAVDVKEGQWIERADEPLLQIDDTFQKSQLVQAHEALAAEQANRAQVELQIDLRKKEKELQEMAAKAAKDRVTSAEERYELRKTVSGIAPGVLKEMEEGIRDLKSLQKIEEGKIEVVALQEKLAKSELDRLAIAVKVKQEAVKQAEKAVAECRLFSPGAGRILKVQTRKGELVGPAFPVPLIEFCPDQPYFIRAEVHQEFAGRVRQGASCRIMDDGAADSREWKGKVARISDWYAHRRSMVLEPLQFNDVRTIECTIELDPGQPPLRIGQRVRVMLGDVWKQP